MAEQRTPNLNHIRDALNARKDVDYPPGYEVLSLSVIADAQTGTDRRPLAGTLANSEERWHFQFGDWRQELPSLLDQDPASLAAFVELVASYLDELWEFRRGRSTSGDISTRLEWSQEGAGSAE